MLRTDKKSKRTAAVITMAAVLCTGILLGGCTPQTVQNVGDGHSVLLTGMEDTPVIDYEMPESTPNILVDCLGYRRDDRKEATLMGEELPEAFRLVDASTGEIVYRGKVEAQAFHEDADMLVGTACFDDYETPGNYYVECGGLGRSYTFPIEDERYIDLFQERKSKILEKRESGKATACETAELLTAFEWYPDLFEDEDGNEIPDVLESVAAQAQQGGSLEETTSDTMRAALLAKFSYLYQDYDRKFATQCLQWASALFERGGKTMRRDAESFFALTELYRATGLYTYRNRIAEYEDFFDGSSYPEETEYLYGAMTYMVTRQTVDVSLCDAMMDRMMERGEELSEGYESVIDPVYARNNGTEEVLSYVQQLVFVNYVLNSYQYDNVLQDFLHYLGGKNRQSVNFYEKEEKLEGLLLLLAQMADEEA